MKKKLSFKKASFCYIFLELLFFFVTFFEKKVAPKNFQREVFSAHSGLDRNVSTNQSVKVLVKLFQKLVGCGATPLTEKQPSALSRRLSFLFYYCSPRGVTFLKESNQRTLLVLLLSAKCVK